MQLLHTETSSNRINSLGSQINLEQTFTLIQNHPLRVEFLVVSEYSILDEKYCRSSYFMKWLLKRLCCNLQDKKLVGVPISIQISFLFLERNNLLFTQFLQN